jgi:hypothetical protein
LLAGDDSSSASSSSCHDNRFERMLHKTLAAAAQAASCNPAPPSGDAAGAGAQSHDNAAAAGGGGDVDDSSSCAAGRHSTGTAAGGAGVSWLHMPTEDPQQPQQQQQQNRLELIGLSTAGVAAGGRAMSQHLGARLAHLSQAQGEVGEGQRGAAGCGVQLCLVPGWRMPRQSQDCFAEGLVLSTLPTALATPNTRHNTRLACRHRSLRSSCCTRPHAAAQPRHTTASGRPASLRTQSKCRCAAATGQPLAAQRPASPAPGHAASPYRHVDRAMSVSCLQVPWAHATFSTKERSRCVIVGAAADGGASHPVGAAAAAAASAGSGVFLGEPVAFYQLASGARGAPAVLLACGVIPAQLALAGPSSPSAAVRPSTHVHATPRRPAGANLCRRVVGGAAALPRSQGPEGARQDIGARGAPAARL